MDRRLFLSASVLASANLAGCGGGGSDAASGLPVASETPSVTNPPIAPVTPATPGATDPNVTSPGVWPQDYVADTSGRILYVSPKGNDYADGAGTLAKPFLTLSHAVTVVDAGDTIVLADGIYPDTVRMTRSGAPGRYITIRAANPGMAELVVPDEPGGRVHPALALAGVGWVRVEGLNVQSDKGHGINATDEPTDPTPSQNHHIQLVGNICHDCGGSGISLEEGDYYLVEGNTVYGNAHSSVFQTSGISVYQARAYDSAAGFHIVIRRNLVYGNVESAVITAEHTDGNGIILDDFHNSQYGSTAGNYTGKTLVENNIVAFNGGDGIAAYESDNVTVRHNTVAFNSTDLRNKGTWRGELSSTQGRDNHWYNNIAVCNSNASPHSNAMVEGVTDGFANTGAVWQGNLLFDIGDSTRAAILFEGTGNRYSEATALTDNPLRAKPMFAVTPSVGNAGNANTFKLATNSPAINAALPAYASPVDYANQARSAQPDIGAFEQL